MSRRTIIISGDGDNDGAVVIEGKSTGGTVFTGTINTSGGTLIMNSSGPVHHGSGTQVNITTRGKNKNN